MGASQLHRGATRNGHAPEWPTIFLALAIHGGWAAATLLHRYLPAWALVAIGGWLIAWHGSLQHETIHGHPTRHARLNAAIASLPLALWLPYRCYHRDHVAHHRAEAITDPLADPESRYLPDAAGTAGRVRIVIAAIEATLLGRMLVGPAITIAGFLIAEARRLRRQPLLVAHDWAPHLLGVALVLAWLSFCRMSLGLYLACFVYPGTALSLLRSFAEHRAAQAPGHRVAIVERAGPFALLFLNNNLHAAHHRAPHLAWFRLPAFYRRHRAAILAENGQLLYRGYGEIARRYGLRAHDVLIHPHWQP